MPAHLSNVYIYNYECSPQKTEEGGRKGRKIYFISYSAHLDLGGKRKEKMVNK